jgi:diguanylate cyclase (GGDEF)-like protein
MNFSTTVNRFIAGHANFDSHDIMRHQFFIYLTLTSIAASLILIVFLKIFQPDVFFGLSTLITIFCFSAAGLSVYLLNGKLNNCCNLLLMGFFIAGLATSLAFLNAYGLTTYYYLGIPIAAYFIAGPKSGKSWTTIAVAAAIVILILKENIINIEVGIEGFSSQHAYLIERNIYIGTIFIIAICCYLYTYLYYRERKILLKQQSKLLHTINYDELTGVYNYKKISELVSDIIDSDENLNQRFAYSFIGIEKFKSINDEYGYDFGDKILKSLVYRLDKVLGENQTLGRLYGTRFALLTINPENQEQVQKSVEKLVAQISGTIKIEGQQIEIITSVGTAIYPIDGTSLKEITTNADKKMLNRT